jgi:hypothetical protein
VSVQLKKPEIMLFADLSEHKGHALLLRTEFLIDYSRHTGRNSLICSLAGLQILSKLQGHNRQPPHLVKIVFYLASFHSFIFEGSQCQYDVMELFLLLLLHLSIPLIFPPLINLLLLSLLLPLFLLLLLHFPPCFSTFF